MHYYYIYINVLLYNSIRVLNILNRAEPIFLFLKQKVKLFH